MFTAGTTSEIITGNNDLGPPIFRTVQNEISNFIPIIIITHFVEQVHTQP